ncbi:MAG: hypothetical protein ABSA96_12280 [Candidatus Acidiferrales bacterium]|jgi:hypothetical protein
MDTPEIVDLLDEFNFNIALIREIPSAHYPANDVTPLLVRKNDRLPWRQLPRNPEYRAVVEDDDSSAFFTSWP